MGRDKALLPHRGGTLAGYVAGEVAAATGGVRILGDRVRHAVLGREIWEDEVTNCGPMGALLTVLRRTETDWNLLVACDMPLIECADLQVLTGAARGWEGDCVVACAPESGDHPLCAVYHRSALPAVERAIIDKQLKMIELIDSLLTLRCSTIPAAHLMNVNTPGQWKCKEDDDAR
jgi:molybdopterin-guanine dinucleotide biosynthesis protein A